MVTVFECASEQNKDADTQTSHCRISLVLLPLGPLTKFPFTSEAQHYAQYRETLFLKNNVFRNCRYLHAWAKQIKQKVYLHVICCSVCEEDCICILYMVQTLILLWLPDKFSWAIFYFTKDKDFAVSIKLTFLNRCPFPVIVQEVT